MISQVWKGGNKMQIVKAKKMWKIGKTGRKTGELQSNWIFMRSAFGCTVLLEYWQNARVNQTISLLLVCSERFLISSRVNNIKRLNGQRRKICCCFFNSMRENEIKGKRPIKELTITSNWIIAIVFASAWLEKCFLHTL